MEAISLPLATIIIQILGLPGLVFIIWHFDNKRDQRKEELRKMEIAERDQAVRDILAQYRDDVSQIRRLYENNVELVKNYDAAAKRQERLYGETLAVISLNTQAQTHLADLIKRNSSC